MKRTILLLCLALTSLATPAFELKVKQVIENVYAIVGEIGPRTSDNHALNNTLGFVVTKEGTVLVSTGATPEAGRLIEQAVASVTNKPIRLVVNIGVQDHHWLGNSYFAEKGIPIKALKRTVDSQHQHVNAQLKRLAAQIGTESKTVHPVYASDVVDADQQKFLMGGISFQLLWPGDGHFTGDAVLWMPEARLVFTGDYVFHNRMLGIHNTESVARWQNAFHVIEKLDPLLVIPGHGYPGDFNKAKHDTGNYLDWLTMSVAKALDDWQELGDTVEELGDAPAYSKLKFYSDWHKRNIHTTYIQFEAER
ncbi:MAG: MBL fold metallo-hydrolase [Candidatus Thiodiazotropha sp.]